MEDLRNVLETSVEGSSDHFCTDCGERGWSSERGAWRASREEGCWTQCTLSGLDTATLRKCRTLMNNVVSKEIEILEHKKKIIFFNLITKI